MDSKITPQCKQIFERISEFIDGEIDPEMCEHIKKHMEGCTDCENFVDSVKKTVDLFRKDKAPMPVETRKALHVALEEQCRTLKKNC